MQKKLAATLSMLSLAACQTIDVNREPPPPEKLVCKEMPAIPRTEALEAIAMPNGVLVYLKEKVDSRDAVIGESYVDVRGVAFDCKSQLQWNKDYWEN